MTQVDAHQPIRIFTVGLDRLMTRAVRADFPGATVESVRTLATNRRHDGSPPAVIIINGARPDAAALRATIWQRWGEAVVVTEIHDRQPIARVWRTPTVFEPVDIGPGFLIPFLPRVRPQPQPQPQPSTRPLTTLRMVGYLAILWNLTVGVHMMDLSRSGVTLTMLGFSVLVLDLGYRSQRGRRHDHQH